MNIQKAIYLLDESIYLAEFKRQSLLKYTTVNTDLETLRVKNLLSETIRLREEFIESPNMKKITVGDWIRNILISAGIGLLGYTAIITILDLLGEKVTYQPIEYIMVKGSTAGIVWGSITTLFENFDRNHNRKSRGYLEKREAALALEKLILNTTDPKILKDLTKRKKALDKECEDIQNEIEHAYAVLKGHLVEEMVNVKKKLSTAK